MLALLALGARGAAQAQLAITEVMSSSSTNLGAAFVLPKSDYWELTNFGTNTLALHGYSFSYLDADPAVRVSLPFQNVLIAGGESIIFLRTDTITNRADFFNWWGAAHLRPNLQVRTCPKKPGLDSGADAVQLFNPGGELVDRVDFGRAFRGHSFVYDLSTGEFGSFSVVTVSGSFQAVQTDDVGSPGVTTGPIPLSFLQSPAGLTADAGSDVQFSARAAGFPRPSFQWFRNGTALPGAKKSSLTLTNVQLLEAGAYTVRISNGLSSLLSAPAPLVVTTNPVPAAILAAPADQIVFVGQTAVFEVQVRGYPPPTLQWRANGTLLSGATNRSLSVAAAGLVLSGTIYSVLVQNIHGSTNVSARLTVTTPPLLAITEVMASVVGGPTSGHTDWFEVTNLDTNAVDLIGYRFSDRYSFDLSYRITNSLVIRPGESVIFTERLTRDEFRDWWGRERLPADVQVTSYTGLGFSSAGDVINLWNSAETDPYSPVAAAGFLESAPGYSQRFLPPDYYFVEDSTPGLDGAFRAANGGDIGSPGYTANPPPRFLSVTCAGGELVLRGRVIEGKQYALLGKTNLLDAAWVTLGSYSTNDSVLTISQPSSQIGPRFFLLKELP